MKNDKEILSDLSPEDLQNLQKELEKKIQVLVEQNKKLLGGVPNLIPKLKEYSTQADFEKPRWVTQHAFDSVSTEMKQLIGGKPKSLKLTKAERIAKSSIEKTSKEVKEHTFRVCVSVCVSLCVSLSMCVSPSQVCRWVSLSQCLCVSLLVFMSSSVCVSLSQCGCLFLRVCVSLSVCVCL